MIAYIFAAALALVAAPCALAALPDEIQVYTDDINEPGEFGVELHLNTTPRGRRTPVPLPLGIGRGLNDAADKWTVKAILTFTFK